MAAPLRYPNLEHPRARAADSESTSDGLYYYTRPRSLLLTTLASAIGGEAADLVERDLHRLEVLLNDVKRPLRRSIYNIQCGQNIITYLPFTQDKAAALF